MTRLQAAMRDSSAKRRKEGRHMYRCGSVFKACANCESHDVYRSYDPKWMGWTWWCYVCGAKDLAAWAPDDGGWVESQLGQPPSFKPREERLAVAKNFRKKMRDHRRQLDKETGEGGVPHSLVTTNLERGSEISNLRRELSNAAEQLRKILGQ